MNYQNIYPPASKPVQSLSLFEKLLKIGRNIPCTFEGGSGSMPERCPCLGWKPKTHNTGRADLCACGHRVVYHGESNDSNSSSEELERRIEIAMRIDKILESKGKLLDFDYQDEEIRSLRRMLSSGSDTTTNKPSKRKLENGEDSATNIYKELEEPLSIPEKPAVIEERDGIIEMRVITNNGTMDNLLLLTSLKNCIRTQLPNMPAEYITRLVYDNKHQSMAIVKEKKRVVGGITFRLFPENNLAEIVFCVVNSDEQAKGYGSHMMNHLKDHLKDNENVKYLMTYADNHAMGFFKKNGFTTEITLERRLWVGFIKDYDEATIMQCKMIPKVKYTRLQEILARQKRAIQIKLAERLKQSTKYPGLQLFHKNGVKHVDPMTIQGIKESGWDPEMEARAHGNKKTNRSIMASITAELKKHAKSWPFRIPVNGDEVPDYYKIIKAPMDLMTIESKVENNCYKTLDDYIQDVRLIFNNCRIYNAEGTIYVKCANGLEKYFNERLKFYDNANNNGIKRKN
ncbi:uncharacterized protein OCT59_009159 [Rhizophagus irregularis]|uniref:histone acetyltransferase n=2 Tax=Rhizophagus irregularis TaxID=588596 RepID=A0A916DYU1_9GLOM|nr:hypothetical protein OCT59_009159 [Rhizophagus irregularis]CAB5151650.1 unnamed protein product [Rhizophagus irregularis]CAB5329386.1 unnamed protein product [Rhizophagus irregularis]